MLRLSAALPGLFFCFFLAAQQPVFTHQQRFRVEDGLPQNFISGIVQDQDGFLWVGTRDGLARYDGRHFKTYRQQYQDSSSLSSSVVTSLTLDNQNKLWILYFNNYVDCFDPRRGAVIKRFDRLSTATVLNENFVEPDFYLFNNEWYLIPRQPRKGIAVFDFENNRHYLYNRANGYLSSDTVAAFTHDSTGNLWLVSPDGIQTTDKRRTKFHTISFPTDLHLRFDSIFRGSVVYNKKGKLIIADEEKLIIYDINQQKFRSIALPVISSADKTDKQVVQHMQADDYGDCYFTYYSRLFKLSENSIINLWNSPLADPFRSTGFLLDRSNVFWYGTNAGGLLKVDLNGFPIASFPYTYNFYADVLNINGISPNNLPAASLKEKWAYHFRYIYDSSGVLYFNLFNHGDYNKIYYWENGKVLSFPFPLAKKAVFDGLELDRDGTMWAVDNFNKRLWHWPDKRSMPSYFDIRSSEFKTPYSIVDLLMIDGDIWLSSEESGLYQWRNGKIINRFHQGSKTSPLSTDMLGDLCHDLYDPKKFWISSLGGGLMLWDVNTGLKKVFTTADGLPNNTIYGIVPDRDGNLWLSTNNGICRFSVKDYSTSVFNASDGLPGAEFNRFHHFKFPDGRLAFGGLEGYAIFNPGNLKHEKTDLAIEITRIDINNVSQQFGNKKTFIKSPLAELKQIDLPYDQNNLAVEFASLFFNEPEKIHYRYMLKGADRDWIESGNDNVVRYTRLRPGNYKLLISASNTAGEWSSKVREISIRVSSPPWATWWAYTIYIMIIAVAVVWFWRYRENMIRMKEQIAFEHREAARLKEIDEFKNRFFNNITHEFRTPLSLIIAPIEILNNDPDLQERTKKILKGVNRNAEQLLNLINQLLDLSKLEAGKMTVNLSSGDLTEFARNSLEPFKALSTEKNIRLRFFSKELAGHFLFDKEKLEQVIFNLLSNALKFTSERGEVSLTLEKVQSIDSKQGLFRIVVSDSGVGIATENLTKVFDRFFQEDSAVTRNYPGTGIGLSLVKELVELMNGSIVVDSVPKKGAVFTVSLPLLPVTYEMATVVEGTATERTETFRVTRSGTDLPLILVAEDNPELRSFLVESLSQKWKVISAPDGNIAWDEMLEELPEVVISDAMMPGRDGFELCSLAKQDSRTAHIGFIMLTAKAAHHSRMEGLEAGADEYLTKPFHLGELEARIRNLLRHQEKVREHLRQQLLPAAPMPVLPHVNDLFLQQLYNVIDERLDDPKLDVETLSGTMAMSRSTLNRKLNVLVGVSANELIRRYRLQKAAALLAAGHEITGTAYTVGFNTPSYFSECFKQQYGKSPSEFTASGQFDSKL